MIILFIVVSINAFSLGLLLKYLYVSVFKRRNYKMKLTHENSVFSSKREKCKILYVITAGVLFLILINIFSVIFKGRDNRKVINETYEKIINNEMSVPKHGV